MELILVLLLLLIPHMPQRVPSDLTNNRRPRFDYYRMPPDTHTSTAMTNDNSATAMALLILLRLGTYFSVPIPEGVTYSDDS